MIITNKNWRNTFETVTGKSHVKIKMPNQDAALSKTISDEILITAVADGHGSKRCFRSHLGANYAVESAVTILEEIQDRLFKDGALNLKAFGKFYTKQIVKLWRDKVDADLKEHPLEENIIEDNDKKSIKKNPYIVYGSTLLIVILVKDFIVCYQLGDGDILFISKSKKVSKPIKRDERHIANDTSSLCLLKPEKEFKIKVFRDLKHVLKMIIISTDGYSNSFSSEHDFMKVGSDLIEIALEDGFEVIDENLKEWIEETSNLGSGDDTSVSVLMRIEEESMA
ncbi:MAG: protein phosphatase 2C domain-containing protein [Clostridia bacterium]|nr:protein phosphatase 2C domain-containing protein [Clostridia bacterium]